MSRLASGGVPLALLVTVVLLSVAAVSSAAPQEGGGEPFSSAMREDAASAEERCIPHPRIEVVGGAPGYGFTLGADPATGEPIYRPGTGVVAGTGTSEDPYVIEGWCIGPNPYLAGIWIQNTTAHVVVRQNVIDGASDFQRNGIVLWNAENVTIADNVVEDHIGAGIRAVDGSSSTTIRNNTIQRNYRGIHVLSGSEEAWVANNTIRDHDDLGMLYSSADGLIEGNVVADNGDDGVVLLSDSDQTMVADNVIEGNSGDAVRLYRASDTRISGNVFADNEGAALRVTEATSSVNAKGNWWGHSSGPSGGVEDACTGEVADGEGGLIVQESQGGICFDPWLSSAAS